MLIMIAYLILAVAVGVYGSERTLGFWGFFVLSLLISPVIVFLFLVLTRTKTKPEV